ncbi:MAG: GNAT family N-acetyltransferase [Candidatus Latescibacterota bacterium]
MIELVKPTIAYRESFLQGADDFASEGRIDSTYATFLGYDHRSIETHFVQFVHDLRGLSNEARVNAGWYMDYVYWLVDGGEYIGQASVRPELRSPYLLTYGGHIGYSIRPSKRRQGYGKHILALALNRAHSINLHRVLVTCDADNIGSRKIIEHNGGVFESSIPMTRSTFRAEGRTGSDPMEKLRYWIDLRKTGDQTAKEACRTKNTEFMPPRGSN